MKTFAISTLGCKVNMYESQGYKQALIDAGLQEVAFQEIADVYIINTCAVTNTAASKSRQKIQQAKKRNAKAIICIVGCLMQTTPEQDYDVTIRIGSSGKETLAKQILDALDGKHSDATFEDMRQISVFESLPIKSFHKQTRAYLKVQDGCNQFCSYCIIPYARGKERSLPFEEALSTAKQLVTNGHKEIVLSGIHTGRYGQDINTNLVSLIKALVTIEGLERIRISSIEMNEISDEFLMLMQQEQKIARHLHIPIQSASDAVLQNMNRPYSVSEFLDKLQKIRSLMPSISISSDIIMGFPNESETAYQETMINLEKINFSFLHVFPFSKRDGTKACEIPNHLSNQVKKERCKNVSLLSKKHYNEYKSSFIGKMVTVLWESEKDGYAFGHSSEYLPVKMNKEHCMMNTIQKVKITSLKEDTLYGE